MFCKNPYDIRHEVVIMPTVSAMELRRTENGKETFVPLTIATAVSKMTVYPPMVLRLAEHGRVKIEIVQHPDQRGI